jgi:hypothetical protein
MPDELPVPLSTTGLPTQEQIDANRGYRVTKWKTFDNFECVKCQYATLWFEKMQKHLAHGVHNWAYPSPDAGRLSEAPPDTEKLDY